MPHRDDSFWISIFKRAPIIASFMAVAGVAGMVIGYVYFSERVVTFGRRNPLGCFVAATTFAGLAVGLIVGTAVDSLIGHWRTKKQNKRKVGQLPDDSPRDHD